MDARKPPDGPFVPNALDLERKGTISLRPEFHAPRGDHHSARIVAPVSKTIFLCVTLVYAIFFSLSGAEGQTSPSAKHHMRYAPRHAVGVASPTLAQQAPSSSGIPPFSWLAGLGVKPYPPGKGCADGLSRNVDDCNMGCIDVPIR
jgi:hypothetical protein